MSKITQALEKAARERQLRQQQYQTPLGSDPSLPSGRASARGQTPLALGSDPSLPSGRASARGQTPLGLETGASAIDPHIVVAAEPRSPIAEQYRILRTNLRSLRRGAQRMQVLLLTSSVHEEGKSVTAINLALSLAQQEGARVLLIDADLRRGTVHRWLGLEGERGLSDALVHGTALENLIVALPGSRLSVLPSGPMPEHPAELLESTSMQRVIEAVRQQFELVLIDAPPILPVADAGILGRWADGALLVVRSGRTQRRTVEKAKDLLTQMKANLVGCILSHAEYYIPSYYRYRYGQYRYGNGNGQPPSGPKQAPAASAASG